MLLRTPTNVPCIASHQFLDFNWGQVWNPIIQKTCLILPPICDLQTPSSYISPRTLLCERAHMTCFCMKNKNQSPPTLSRGEGGHRCVPTVVPPPGASWIVAKAKVYAPRNSKRSSGSLCTRPNLDMKILRSKIGAKKRPFFYFGISDFTQVEVKRLAGDTQFVQGTFVGVLRSIPEKIWKKSFFSPRIMICRKKMSPKKVIIFQKKSHFIKITRKLISHSKYH